MMERTDPALWSSMISHLRHDLIKHLDIPKEGGTMSRPSWEVLRRRLYGEHVGVVNTGWEWISRLRRQAEAPQLEPALEALSLAIDRIDTLQPDFNHWLAAGAKAPAPLVHALQAFVNAVRGLEAKLNAFSDPQPSTAPAALPPPPALPTPDEDAALDWMLNAPLAHPSTASPPAALPATPPPLKPPLDPAAAEDPWPADGERCRVLVVDDRLHAIERFQAMEYLRDRFDWVTLCELKGPCWSCPHRDGCGLKRARLFREMEGALRRAQSQGKPIDVLLMDVRFDDLAAGELLPPAPGMDPEDLDAARALQGPLMVRALRQRTDLPSVPVVLMTGRRSLPVGAERLLEGLDGLHFVDDEASIEALTARLDAVARRRRRPVSEGAFFWGRSPAMQSVREQIELLAAGPRPVLLTGPSGTGKSFLVEEVLLPMSGRSHLVTIDLSALPETLVESELFGHTKGAFSGAVTDRPGLIEESDGGILFIDEIGHLSAETQRKLLLFLQDRQTRRVGASTRTRRQVDVKVVAATHMDLNAEVEAGRFRFDLFMRLRPATQVRLPSLRERPEDLDGMMSHLVHKLANDPELAHLVQTVARARSRTPQIDLMIGSRATLQDGLGLRLPDATAAALRSYPWPGNTRELESVLDTLLLRALADARLVSTHGPIIEVDHYLALKLLGVGRPKATTGRPVLSLPIEPATDLKQMRHRLERAYLIEAFHAGEGDMERVTELILGSDHPEDRHRLTVRMNQLGLKVTELKLGN
jgi:DNA-binding NtrC family response regulator